MLRYLFGVGENTGSLHNEPTIDYDNTIQTIGRETSSARTVDDNFRRYNHTSSARNGYNNQQSYAKTGNIIDYSDDELDSDEEMTRDYNVIMDNFTRTSDRLSRYSYGQSTNHSLPSEYPGKFRTDSKQEVFERRDQPKKSRFEYEYSRQPASSRPYSAPDFASSKAESTRNRYSNIAQDNTDQLYTHRIDQQINQLQHQVDQELSLKKNDDLDIAKVRDKVRQQNKFLSELNSLVDINSSESVQEKIPHNLLEKYKTMKADYINELNNSQALYKGYYKLIQKYRSLRKQGSNTKKSPVNKSNFNIKEKVRLIKSTSNQESVKLACSNILSELEGIETKEKENQELIAEKDKLIEQYKQELEQANQKIKLLESGKTAD